MSVDYPDFGAPQAHATAISVTGVPLLTGTDQLATINTPVAAGGPVSLGPWYITQPSYEIYLNAVASNAGAAGPLLVNMLWYDDAGFNVISDEEYYVWPAPQGGQHLIIGRGPTKGQALYMTLQNYSGAANYTVTGAVYQRSHIYTRDNWYSRYASASESGGNYAVFDTPALLVGGQSVSVAAAGLVAYELPLAVGPAYLHADTSSLTTDMRLSLLNSAGEGNVALGATLARFSSDANGFINQQITLPRYQCKIQMSNSNAAAKALSFQLHLIDQPA